MYAAAMVRVASLLALALLLPATVSAAPLTHGTTKLSFDVGFGLTLYQQGVDATPVAPATQDSLTFSLPVTGGRTKGKHATVRHKGGFHMEDTADSTVIDMRNLAITVTGRRVKLSGLAAIDDITYDSFTFATGTAGRVRRTRHGIAIRHFELHLNGIAVAALNSQFQTTVFKAGQLLGTGRLSAS
jgi:hypothetical protein